MSIEVSLSIIAIAVFALTIFLFFVLADLRKTLRKTTLFLKDTQKDIHRISHEGCELLEHMNGITANLQNVSQEVSALFQPFHHDKKDKDMMHKVPEILDALAKTLYAVNHVKEGIKQYVKSR
jgi:uncharacterized protein YoxC